MKIETFIAWAVAGGCKLNGNINSGLYGRKFWIMPNGDTLVMPEMDEDGDFFHHGMIINMLGFAHTDLCYFGDGPEYWSVVSALCAHFGIVRAFGDTFHVWNSRGFKGLESYLLKNNKDNSRFDIEVGERNICAHNIGPIADYGFSAAKALAASSRTREGSFYASTLPSEYVVDFFESVCVEDIDAEV